MTAAHEMEPKIQNPTAPDENVHDDTETDDEAETVRYRITSYGADFDMIGLVRRINEGSIFVPDFQRSFVWTAKQASQFIESLLLDLPVPGIFLTVEPETKRMMVIDGQQRLKTLQFFYAGEFAGNPDTGEQARRFTLRGVDPAFEGKSYDDLPASDRRQLDDSLVHATITRQLYPGEGMSSVFHIFQRLNSTGQRLTPHEIRQAIYSGPLLDAIRELNENPDWRAVFGAPKHRRQKDQELILRFWALYRQSDAYRRPMLGFLNNFAESYREPNAQFIKDGKALFPVVIEHFRNALGQETFRTKDSRQLNAAVFDSMSVGLACRIAQREPPPPDAVRATYRMLLSDADYLTSVSLGTAQETAVRTRIAKSVAAFGEA